MKINNLIKLILILVVVLIASQTTKAQYAYGSSRIVYDNTTKKVTTTSITRLDYYAGLYYDPAVVGDVYKQGVRAGIAYDEGFANVVPARVVLQTINPAPPNTRYDLYSDHYVIAYFYVEVIITDDDGTPLSVRRWYDPLGFRALGGGHSPGWYEYNGSSRRESFDERQLFYLGTTGIGLITDPPPCSGVNAVADGSCPDDLTVELRNIFKDGDLSNTTQNVLFGAQTDLHRQFSQARQPA